MRRERLAPAVLARAPGRRGAGDVAPARRRRHRVRRSLRRGARHRAGRGRGTAASERSAKPAYPPSRRPLPPDDGAGPALAPARSARCLGSLRALVAAGGGLRRPRRPGTGRRVRRGRNGRVRVRERAVVRARRHARVRGVGRRLGGCAPRRGRRRRPHALEGAHGELPGTASCVYRFRRGFMGGCAASSGGWTGTASTGRSCCSTSTTSRPVKALPATSRRPGPSGRPPTCCGAGCARPT